MNALKYLYLHFTGCLLVAYLVFKRYKKAPVSFHYLLIYVRNNEKKSRKCCSMHDQIYDLLLVISDPQIRAKSIPMKLH